MVVKPKQTRAERRRLEREAAAKRDENITRRGFEYLANGINPQEKVSLVFKLRTDVAGELEVFLGLLKKAVVDVQEELDKVNKKTKV